MQDVQPPPRLNLFRERERTTYGFSPEKGRGFKFDDRGVHRDGAQATEPSQRSMREEMLEYLALEKDRKEAERRREEQERKESAMDGEETLFQEKKRSTYKYDPERGFVADDFVDNPVLDLKNAGNAAFGEGNYDEAIEAYNKALALKPPADLESIIYGNVSLTLLNMGKLTEALEAADNAIFADERRARNHFRRSRVLHKMGMHKAALDALWKAQELSPYDVSIDLAVAQERKFVYTMAHHMTEEVRALVSPMPHEAPYLTLPTGETIPGSSASSGCAWKNEMGNGSLLVLSSKVDRGNGVEAQGFVYIANPLDWQLLERDEHMGQRRGPRIGLSSMMGDGAIGNSFAAQRLREELGKIPWAESFAGQMRLVREFQPLAVALLLRRWDWLTPEEVAFLDKTGLAAAAELHRGEGARAALTTGGGQAWTGLIPLLKASLYCPHNHVTSEMISAGRRGTVDELDDALMKKGSGMPAVVYDAARAWIEEVAPGALSILELVTCMAVNNQPARLLYQLLTAGVEMSSVDKIEEGVYVSFAEKSQAKRKKGQGPQASGHEWKSPKSWKCFLPHHGVDAALRIQQKGQTYMAVEAGDANTVRALMRSFRAVNGQSAVFDESGEAPLANGACFLHLAAQLGHTEVVQVLVKDGGYEVDARDEAGITPMMLAAQEGHLDLVEWLLGNKASYVAQAKSGAGAVHEAVIGGHVEIVKLLMAQASSKFTHVMVGKGGTPLMLGVLLARQEIVQVLIDAGARVPEGPPPATFLKTLRGPPSKLARMPWLETFYVAVLQLLPSIQGDSQRILDTFLCLKLFQKYHKPPLNGVLHAQLDESEWEIFFPSPPEDDEEAAGGGDGADDGHGDKHAGKKKKGKSGKEGDKEKRERKGKREKKEISDKGGAEAKGSTPSDSEGGSASGGSKQGAKSSGGTPRKSVSPRTKEASVDKVAKAKNSPRKLGEGPNLSRIAVASSPRRAGLPFGAV